VSSVRWQKLGPTSSNPANYSHCCNILGQNTDAQDLRIPGRSFFGRSEGVTGNSDLKRRPNSEKISKTTELVRNSKGPIPGVLPTEQTKSVQLLEVENAELRRRAAELVVDIQALREG
jgi:hypothetical protein